MSSDGRTDACTDVCTQAVLRFPIWVIDPVGNNKMQGRMSNLQICSESIKFHKYALRACIFLIDRRKEATSRNRKS